MLAFHPLDEWCNVMMLGVCDVGAVGVASLQRLYALWTFVINQGMARYWGTSCWSAHGDKVHLHLGHLADAFVQSDLQ